MANLGSSRQATSSSSAASPVLTKGQAVQATGFTTPAGLATALTPISLPAFGPLSGIPGKQVIVDPQETFQTFYGVGAAITDAACYVMDTYLTPAQKQSLLQEAFGANGLSTIRICFGSSDYTSVPWYTYDDVPNDAGLTNFSIAPDLARIIPTLQQIIAINPRVRIIAGVWSPPAWLKSSNSLISGSLNATSANLTTLANYYTMAIQAYESYGIRIWAVSTQNEPNNSATGYPCCGWAATDIANFVGNYLGPAFDAADIRTRILVGDLSWAVVGNFISTPLATQAAFNYADGMAFHGYHGTVFTQDQQSRPYPSKSVHMTEYLTYFGYSLAQRQAIMAGDMAVASIRHGASSLTLWNFALDQQGNPQSIYLNGAYQPNIGASGVVNIGNGQAGSTLGQVIRTPEFYMLTHLGKAVKPGAKRCKANTFAEGSAGTDVETVAFVNPDGSVVLFLYNAATTSQVVTVTDAVTGYAFPLTMAVGDMTTVTWAPPVTIVTAGTLTAPGAPTSLTATPASAGGITLAWTPPAVIGSTALGGYVISRGTTAGGEALYSLAVTAGTATTFSDATAISGTTYYYTVAAYGGGGSSAASNEAVATATTAVPGVPTVSIASGNAQNVLTFAPTTTGGSAITGYRIYRATTAGAETLETTVTSSPFTDTGLTNGTAYFYQITAVNAVGESAKSTEVNATPAVAPINYLSIPASGRGSAYMNPFPGNFIPAASQPMVISALVEPSSLTEGYQYIFGGFPANGSATSTTNAAYEFLINPTGNLVFQYMNSSGTVVTGTSSAVLPSSITSTPLWVRCSVNSSTGALTFSTSPDGSTYTQLGSLITLATTGTINTGDTGAVVIGGGTIATGSNFVGNIYEVSLAINGSTTFLLNFETAATGASSVTDSAGNVWLISPPAAIA